VCSSHSLPLHVRPQLLCPVEWAAVSSHTLESISPAAAIPTPLPASTSLSLTPPSCYPASHATNAAGFQWPLEPSNIYNASVMSRPAAPAAAETHEGAKLPSRSNKREAMEAALLSTQIIVRHLLSSFLEGLLDTAEAASHAPKKRWPKKWSWSPRLLHRVKSWCSGSVWKEVASSWQHTGDQLRTGCGFKGRAMAGAVAEWVSGWRVRQRTLV
jgi:hypothetical protein